ncbi:MAG: carboxypeptidase regulatory-like domain-containing protein [Nitrospirae bacterium]|nr:MAG: carboxypeptidase regulatory-like domain-containing protein [Nitrospirota bacterium]
MALLPGLGIVLIGGVSAAYDVVEVTGGGVVTGRVSLEGPAPAPKGYNLVIYPDPQYCGRISNGNGWRLLHDFVVDGSGGLKDAVVMLEGVSAGKAFGVSVPHVEARDCKFLPFVTVVRDGHAVEVVNMDPVMHDIQAYETSTRLGARVLFNSPLPMNGHHKRGDLHASHEHELGTSLLGPIYLSKGRRTFVMQCGFHPYMESWALAIDNPYYAITDASGAFTIADIPSGTYRLVAWHPQAGLVSDQVVTVEPNGTVTTALSLKAPGKHRTAHEVVENPRFGPGSLGRSVEIVPIVERQR